MNKVYLDSKIFYIENFLNNEDFDYIHNVALDTKIWKTDDNKIPQRKRKDLTSSEYDFFWKNFLYKINTIFDINQYDISETRHLQAITEYKNQANANEKYALWPHMDDQGYKKAHRIKTKDEIISFGCVYYINDNYRGGELEYTKKNIIVKPKSNMLIVHSGEDDYEHGVKQVYGGTRYFIPIFILNKFDN